jgi:hypothetical protein
LLGINRGLTLIKCKKLWGLLALICHRLFFALTIGYLLHIDILPIVIDDVSKPGAYVTLAGVRQYCGFGV